MYDIAIIGFGPVGACFAGLVAKSGLKVAVIEKDKEVFPLPRAAHVDHTGLRTVQEMGCLNEVLVDVVRNKRLDIVNADQEVLVRTPADQESVSGLPTSIYFYQPDFDRALRKQAASHDNVTVYLGSEMARIRNHQDHVDIDLKDGDGTASTIQAKWVVGCDGAWSPVREALGIKLESLNFDEQWLVVDVVLDSPQDNPWSDHAVEVCDPSRPYLSTPICGNRHRFEVMLLPGETAENIDKEALVRERLSAWFPEGGYKIERAAVYTFHGVVAENWRKGRTFIAGDAAHQTPPFLGQGMVVGFRDASNLAWKLVSVLKGAHPEALLDSYEGERKPHAIKVIEAAIRIGKVICVLDPEKAKERDKLFLANDPTTHKSLVFKNPPFKQGTYVLPGGGKLFVQPEIDSKRLDDIVGTRFFVLGRDEDALGDAGDWWRDQTGAMVTTLADMNSPDLAAWMDRKSVDVVVVRPDRYVLGAGNSLQEITDKVAPHL